MQFWVCALKLKSKFKIFLNPFQNMKEEEEEGRLEKQMSFSTIFCFVFLYAFVFYEIRSVFGKNLTFLKASVEQYSNYVLFLEIQKPSG